MSWPVCQSQNPPCPTCSVREAKQSYYHAVLEQYNKLNQQVTGLKVAAAVGATMGAVASIATNILLPGVRVNFNRSAGRKNQQQTDTLVGLSNVMHQLHEEICSIICPFSNGPKSRDTAWSPYVLSQCSAGDLPAATGPPQFSKLQGQQGGGFPPVAQHASFGGNQGFRSQSGSGEYGGQQYVLGPVSQYNSPGPPGSYDGGGGQYNPPPSAAFFHQPPDAGQYNPPVAGGLYRHVSDAGVQYNPEYVQIVERPESSGLARGRHNAYVQPAPISKRHSSGSADFNSYQSHVPHDDRSFPSRGFHHQGPYEQQQYECGPESYHSQFEQQVRGGSPAENNIGEVNGGFAAEESDDEEEESSNWQEHGNPQPYPVQHPNWGSQEEESDPDDEVCETSEQQVQSREMPRWQSREEATSPAVAENPSLPSRGWNHPGQDQESETESDEDDGHSLAGQPPTAYPTNPQPLSLPLHQFEHSLRLDDAPARASVPPWQQTRSLGPSQGHVRQQTAASQPLARTTVASQGLLQHQRSSVAAAAGGRGGRGPLPWKPADNQCDGCSKVFQPHELFHKCDTCKRYHMCEACHASREFHHPYHKGFSVLRTEGVASNKH